MMTLAQFLSETALHTWIVGQAWLWPVLEITHFIGLTLLIGGLLVVDLRVLGVSASTPLLATYRLLPLVLLGFGLNLISGVFFSVGDPFRYAANIGFQAKMVFVLLAGANAALSSHQHYATAYWLGGGRENASGCQNLRGSVAARVEYGVASRALNSLRGHRLGAP